MTDKQIIELGYARPIINQLCLGDCVRSSDSPDLLVDKGECIVGIEVTSCYPDDKSGSYVALEKRMLEVCKDYSNKLKNEGIKGIWAIITFKDIAFRFDAEMSTKQFKDLVLNEIDIKREQDRLLQSLKSKEAINDFYFRVEKGEFECRFIEEVSFHRFENIDHVEVSPSRTDYITTLDVKYVFDCIRKKESKLKQYKELPKNGSISEYWLIIYCPADTFCDLEDFVMPSFESSFERVYIRDNERVIQLK